MLLRHQARQLNTYKRIALPPNDLCLGLARTIHVQCIYGIFGREITIYTVIHGVNIRFWPTKLKLLTTCKAAATVGNRQDPLLLQMLELCARLLTLALS